MIQKTMLKIVIKKKLMTTKNNTMNFLFEDFYINEIEDHWGLILFMVDKTVNFLKVPKFFHYCFNWTFQKV